MAVADRFRRTHDGWDEDFLGKVYDAEVVRRLLPYMKEWKFHAFGSLVLLVITAVSQFIQPSAHRLHHQSRHPRRHRRGRAVRRT